MRYKLDSNGRKRVTLIAGDGIGPEVANATRRIIDATGVKIAWRGTGVAEQGYDVANGRILIEIDKRYFRPTEVDLLQGDAGKARRVLGWSPEVSVHDMIKEMVAEDLKHLKAAPLRAASHD